MPELQDSVNDLDLPVALTEVATVILAQDWDYDDDWDEDTDVDPFIDFEPYPRFLPAEVFARTFRSWTGNDDVDGGQFRVFGSTAAGDLFGFWLGRPGAAIEEQPVIYLGSEGGHAVIAADLGDLLWFFANGFLYDAEPNQALAAIAERHAPGRRRSNAEIKAAAREQFPDFPRFVQALCR